MTDIVEKLNALTLEHYPLGNIAAEAAREIERLRSMLEWQPIETAPKDQDILVWYDHEADPYQDPECPGKLTDYGALAESGDFLDGQGVTVAKWEPRQWERLDEYGGGYWLPGGWFSKNDGCYDHVCNPTHWRPLPPLPAKEGE